MQFRNAQGFYKISKSFEYNAIVWGSFTEKVLKWPIFYRYSSNRVKRYQQSFEYFDWNVKVFSSDIPHLSLWYYLLSFTVRSTYGASKKEQKISYDTPSVLSSKKDEKWYFTSNQQS